METSRRMNPDDVKKILVNFQTDNSKSLNNIRILVNEFENLSSMGKKYINKRTNYYCGELKTDLNKIIDDDIKNSFQTYSKLELFRHKYQKCINLSKNKFIEVHEKLESFISNIKENQKQQLDRCFVLNYEEKKIKECLQKKIIKKEEKLYFKLKDYHAELIEFSKNIYL